MKLKYEIKNKKWNFEVAELIQRHDVVFGAPVPDPTYGLPIGDGDTGSLLWITENCLKINVNKTDLIDLSTKNDAVTGCPDEENISVFRNGASLTFDFGCPIFEVIY